MQSILFGQENSLTLKRVSAEIKTLSSLFIKLNVQATKANACIEFNGKKICGLIQRGDSKGISKYLVFEKGFKMINYYHVPQKITKLQRDRNIISYHRISEHWVRETRKVHKKIRKIVHEKVISKILRDSSIKKVVDEAIEQEEEKKRPLHSSFVVNQIIQKNYKHLYDKVVGKVLRSKKVQEMRTQLKDVLVHTREEDPVRTEEMISVPNALRQLTDHQLASMFVLDLKIN